CEFVDMDETESRRWLRNAVALYRSILSSAPDHHRADEVMAYLGLAWLELGSTEQAMDAFRTLIDRYPDSPWTPDAYIHLGEYLFAKGSFEEAEWAFTRAGQFPDSRHQPYAWYMLAWVHYSRNRTEAAVALLRQLVQGAKEQGKEDVLTYALPDLMRFNAEVERPHEAR
ncbi:MAG: tetratricopeptide repeat protein, partial [Myxococcota bacterium]